MTRNDDTDGLGYVICGYLDAEGPESATAEGEPFSGRPFQTVEEAVAEIHANGGPRPDANIFIGVVVPVALVVQPDQEDAANIARAFEIEDAYGAFYNNGDFELLQKAGNGVNAPSVVDLFDNEGEVD